MGRLTKRALYARARKRIEHGLFAAAEERKESEDVEFLEFNVSQEAADAINAQVLGKRRAVYTGDSRTSTHRKKVALDYVLKVCPMNTIESFMEKQAKRAVPRRKRAVPRNIRELQEHLDKLNASKPDDASLQTTYKRLAVIKCLEFQIKSVGKVQAAKRASRCLPECKTWTWRLVYNWTVYYIAYGKMHVSQRGRGQTTLSMLADEDVKSKVVTWLRTTKKNRRSPAQLTVYLNDELLPSILGESARVTLRTAARWMNTLGYKYGLWQKGVYIDGHERADVVEYRTKFLQRMKERMPSMATWSGDMMELKSKIEEGKDEIVWVSHDESIFYTNDDGSYGWGNEERPDLHKKGKGKCIMVSDFICPCHGRITYQGKPVAQVFEPGVNFDGWWEAKDILRQLEEKAIKGFEEMHGPTAQALFIFDNSTNHCAFAEDALVATRMVGKDGGKNAPIMKDTTYKNAEGVTVLQKMVTADGKPRGIKSVLIERGLWVDKCKIDCKDNTSTVTTCCAKHLLAAQPDFVAQQSILYECIAKSRHLCDFLPKFHCELAPIEAFWGSSKRYTRAHCDYSITALRVTVPEALASVSVVSIRKFFRRSLHLMQAYTEGYSLKLARYAHQKYKSHRAIPEGIMQEIIAEIELEEQKQQ